MESVGPPTVRTTRSLGWYHPHRRPGGRALPGSRCRGAQTTKHRRGGCRFSVMDSGSTENAISFILLTYLPYIRIFFDFWCKTTLTLIFQIGFLRKSCRTLFFIWCPPQAFYVVPGPLRCQNNIELVQLFSGILSKTWVDITVTCCTIPIVFCVENMASGLHFLLCSVRLLTC